MEYREFSAKTVEEALAAAADELALDSASLDYEVIEKGSRGFLGKGQKDALIRVAVEESPTAAGDAAAELARVFLEQVFEDMNMSAELDIYVDDEEKNIDIDISGENMGLLIGKRGQTLDSLQYLCSLAVNRKAGDYYRIRLDIEDYRYRREETLKKLARSVSSKVRRTRRPVALEPMNPYERRIIHSALQNDRYTTTHSEGEEPFRYVVISLKR